MAETGVQHSNLRNFLATSFRSRRQIHNRISPVLDRAPELFCAPAHKTTPELRVLAVLKWFLASLRGQQYAGRRPNEGIKKPLNAFLGEVFMGECGAEGEECRLISEQVSHHPPVTACYLWNDRHGVRAEGCSRQEITFNGSVNIKQSGHAILTIEKYGEEYLIPLPSVKIKGILTSGPYPELHGTYSIVSSTGFIAEITFEGKGFLGISGRKNHVGAVIYHTHDKERKALFTAEGSWSESFAINDSHGKKIDEYDSASAAATDFRAPPLDSQDPWESRNAWRGVIDSIHAGNMQGVADHKNKLENAQRAMRKRNETSKETWQALFFRREEHDIVAERLLGESSDPKGTCGTWKSDRKKATDLKKPWRAPLTPYGDYGQ